MLDEQLFQENGDQRQSVDGLVHPDRDDFVERLGKDELTIDEVQTPESDAHELERDEQSSLKGL